MPRSDIAPSVRKRARMLRKSTTRGEREMQVYLRSLRPFGAHFRREVPIGPYVVDFAWLSARIAIEVDGASHDLEGRDAQDEARDCFLRSQGFVVVRVRDADVIANSPTAFAPIENAIARFLRTPPPARPSTSSGRATPSPQGGGETRSTVEGDFHG